ncbi:MAG: LysM peptidoglycan-binding domain-containing protein [Desulfuromonadaceae bacterium]|nr:LysM peptidoglycan-binding domain-containing protein [Desulfuromonadaceae bacterium]MDD2853917.1 LysM peptidoglycan-binding domain-containing protein [Desulfuromonadaceae bacterium]
MKINWGTNINMSPFGFYIVLIAIIISFTQTAFAEDYLLYTPEPVSSKQRSSSQDGILVQKIEIKKGDTLYDISRKFSGHGMYFPQILLFNSISNPNMIYPGSSLKVPVTRSTTAVSEPVKKSGPVKAVKHTKKAPATTETTNNIELSLSDLQTLGSKRKQSKPLKNKTALLSRKSRNTVQSAIPVIHAKSEEIVKTANQTDSAPANDGKQLFESAVKAYRKDDCSTALKLLDRYIAENSRSPLAADASLYRAECYMKMSAQ